MVKIIKFFVVLTFFVSNFLCSSHFLSFIMPCYNCADTVKRAIHSIHEQNLRIPFEVICTDDGSTDSTLSVLKSCQQEYPSLKIMVHEANQGAGAAANTCVFYSQGDLIFRLDADNVLVPDSINLLIDLLDAGNYDGATFQELRFFGEYPVQHSTWKYQAPGNVCDLKHCITVGQDPAHSGNYLYTKKSFNRAGGYPSQRGGTDTFCFGFKQYATGARIAILPNSSYWHFHNANGYWYREERSGRNHALTLCVLRDFSEVFSESTNIYLKNFVSGNPIGDAERGRLALASQEILDSLFAGYKNIEDCVYDKALTAFRKAVARGCRSEKIMTIIRGLEKIA